VDFIISFFFSALCLDSNGNPISTNPFEKPNDCDNFYQVSRFGCLLKWHIKKHTSHFRE